MTQIVEKIKSELEAFDQKKKALVEQLRTEFPTMFKELFDQFDKIDSIGWVQYTPYFNDGDECIFGVHCESYYGLYVNGECADELDELSEEKYQNGQYVKNKNFNKEFFDQVALFRNLLSSIPEDFMKDLFGDHAQITIHKDGLIEVEEYDHD